MHRLTRSINVRCSRMIKGDLKHEIMQSFYDVVIFLPQRELSGSSLICVKSVKKLIRIWPKAIALMNFCAFFCLRYIILYYVF